MIQDATRPRPSAVGWARWAGALGCTIGSALLYRTLIRLAPVIASAEPTDACQVFPWVKPFTHHSILAIHQRTQEFPHLHTFIACCAGLLALYGAMLCVSRGVCSGRFALAAAAGPAICMAMLLCAPVMFSSDTYAYAYYGRLLAVYGADAHAASPAASLADPFLANGLYDFVPSVYGPLWTVLSAGVTWTGGENVGLALLLFRVLEAAAALACAALIWLILSRLRPALATAGTLLFLWNPVVILETALGGHNDTCMMALALLAVWLHLRGWKSGAVIALILSALVKVITLPLVPLYILMILRGCPDWRARISFAIRSALGAIAAIALAMFAARMSPTGLVAHTAGSAGFYKNNYHELIFKELRHLLGEPANTLDAPMDFRVWWVATNARTPLHADILKQSPTLALLQPGQPLLALSDKDSEQWLRVYDPSQRKIGFVDRRRLVRIPTPPNAQADPVVRQLAVSPQDWPTVVTANRWIRVTTWTLLAAFGLLAAWKTRDLETFLTWGTSFFLAALLLVFTRLWPWYIIWPLALGALTPRSAATRLALLLSAGLILFYPLQSYCNTRLEWLYDYRSLITIVLPVVAFAVLQLLHRMSTRSMKPGEFARN